MVVCFVPVFFNRFYREVRRSWRPMFLLETFCRDLSTNILFFLNYFRCLFDRVNRGVWRLLVGKFGFKNNIYLPTYLSTFLPTGCTNSISVTVFHFLVTCLWLSVEYRTVFLSTPSSPRSMSWWNCALNESCSLFFIDRIHVVDCRSSKDPKICCGPFPKSWNVVSSARHLCLLQ